MIKILAFGLGLFAGGFFMSWFNDSWSYFANYVPPSTDVFYTLMMMIWHMYPFLIMFLGIIVLLLGAKGQTYTVVDE